MNYRELHNLNFTAYLLYRSRTCACLHSVESNAWSLLYETIQLLFFNTSPRITEIELQSIFQFFLIWSKSSSIMHYRWPFNEIASQISRITMSKLSITSNRVLTISIIQVGLRSFMCYLKFEYHSKFYYCRSINYYSTFLWLVTLIHLGPPLLSDNFLPSIYLVRKLNVWSIARSCRLMMEQKNHKHI